MDYLINAPSQLGLALKSARKVKELTQASAAARVGLLPKTISALENHPEACSIESLLYDIMSAYPVLVHGSGLPTHEKLRLAMAYFGKNHHYEWSRIGPRHLRESALCCGMREAIDGVIGKLVARIPGVIAELSAALPKGFPDKTAEPIFKGIEKRAKLLEAE